MFLTVVKGLARLDDSRVLVDATPLGRNFITVLPNWLFWSQCKKRTMLSNKRKHLVEEDASTYY